MSYTGECLTCGDHHHGPCGPPSMYPPGLGRHVGLHTPGASRPGGVDVCSVCGERSDGLHDASLYAAGADFHNAAVDLGRQLLVHATPLLVWVLRRLQRWLR